MTPQAARLQRVLIRKRRRTLLRKADEFHKLCGAEVYLVLYKRGKFYAYSSNRENALWPPALKEIVSRTVEPFSSYHRKTAETSAGTYISASRDLPSTEHRGAGEEGQSGLSAATCGTRSRTVGLVAFIFGTPGGASKRGTASPYNRFDPNKFRRCECYFPDNRLLLLWRHSSAVFSIIMIYPSEASLSHFRGPTSSSSLRKHARTGLSARGIISTTTGHGSVSSKRMSSPSLC